jgi:hypothetical protein
VSGKWSRGGSLWTQIFVWCCHSTVTVSVESIGNSYPYHVVILLGTLIVFSTKIMHQSKLYQGAYLTMCSPRNHMENVSMNNHTMLINYSTMISVKMMHW